MKKKILSMITVGMVISVLLLGCGSTPTVEKPNVVTEEASEGTAEKTEENAESEEQEQVEEMKEPEIITVYLKVKETIDQDGYTWLSHEYEYDDYGNEIKNTNYGSSGDLGEITETAYEYDANGRILKKAIHITGESGETFTSEEAEYEYDNKGKLLKSTTTYFSDEVWLEMSGETHSVYECEYDDRGNVVKMVSTRYTANGPEEVDEDNYEYEYDAEGRIIKEIAIYSEDAKNIIEYEYDENGSRILNRGIVIYEDGTEEVIGEDKTIYEYEYNEAGNVIKRTYAIEGNTDKKHIDEYDENGNIIKSSQVWDDGYVETYLYEYIEMQVPDVPKVG